MTETAEHTTTPPPPPPVGRDVADRNRPRRLPRAFAWVGIVTGVVFIVAVVFFSGFILGKHSGGHGPRGHHDRASHVVHRGGPPHMGPMVPWAGPGAPKRPGGPVGPGGPGNTQSPTTAPSPTPAPSPRP